ncbi:MAG: lactonase family protein [Gammaproteobacteria bacterium]|nr:lactonase family protein [Gammaproteobacteria bacterium]
MPVIKRKAVYVYLSFLAICCSINFANAEAPAMAQPVAQTGALFLYSVNAFDSSIASFRVDENNSGKLIHNGHWPTDQFPTAVITHPSSRFLYVASKVSDEIDIYQINSRSGRLKLLQGKSVSAGRAPHLFAMAPSGDYLYVALRSGGIAVFTVNNNDGTLTPVPGSPFLAEKRTRSVVVHPGGQFVYASNAHSNSISAYRVNSKTGALIPLPNAPFAAGDKAPMGKFMDPMLDMPSAAGAMPYYVAIDPTGKFLYVTNWNSASVSAFRIDINTGQLSPVNGSPFSSGFNPYVVVVHPSGRYVYVSGYTPNVISGYSIESTSGALTSISNSPYETHGNFPIAIQFDKEGKVAYVSNYKSNNISIFDIDLQTGALSFTDLIQTRSGPRDLSLVAGTNLVAGASQAAGTKKTTDDYPYLYAINSDTDMLMAYKKSPITEKWNKVASVRTGKNPSAIAIHPLSNVVYVANKTSNNISSFQLNTKTQQFMSVKGSPYSVNKSPSAITFDTNGRFLYITNQGSNKMSVFEVNTDSGMLIQTNSTHFSTGPEPLTITIDPSDRYAYVLNTGDNSISLFRYRTADSPLIDNLSRVGGVFQTGDKPVSLTVDSSGRFLYVANKNTKNISAYLVDVQSGFLQSLKGAPFNVQGSPVSLITHPRKSYLYVLNRDPNNIVIYKIDKIKGELQQVQSLLSTVESPTKLEIDTKGNILYLFSRAPGLLQSYAIDKETGRLNPSITGATKIDASEIAIGFSALR